MKVIWPSSEFDQVAPPKLQLGQFKNDSLNEPQGEFYYFYMLTIFAQGQFTCGNFRLVHIIKSTRGQVSLFKTDDF